MCLHITQPLKLSEDLNEITGVLADLAKHASKIYFSRVLTNDENYVTIMTERQSVTLHPGDVIQFANGIIVVCFTSHKLGVTHGIR